MVALLDDPDRQTRVVEGISRGETLAEIAAELGTTRQTISRHMAKHPDLKRRVDVARERVRRLAHERSRTTVVDAELVDDLDMLGLPSPAALGRLLWRTANDPTARGQGRAQSILAELVYRPIVREMERAAESEQSEPTSGLVILDLSCQGMAELGN